jgi:glycosyltransferase involved in cell wall biosynthesis
MRITFDITAAIYGRGVSYYTTNLFRELVSGFSDIDWIGFGGSFRQYSVLKKQLPAAAKSAIYPLPPSLFSSLFNTFQMPIDWLIPPSDIFHAWDWYVPQSSKASLVTTIHDVALFKYPKVAHPKIKAQHQLSITNAIRQQAHFIAVSKATKADFIDHFNVPETNVTVVHEALPAELKHKPSSRTLEKVKKIHQLTKPYLLMVGTQEPRKNIPRTIKAWQKFAKDFDLVIVGEAGWENIKPQAGLIRTGWLNPTDLAALYQEASAFLYPSLYEGFGLPILEAFYHHTPVVTSAISSMPEVAGDAAILVDPTSTEAIIDGIRQALNQSASLKQKGTVQLNRFSWQRAAQETVAVYQSSLKD